MGIALTSLNLLSMIEIAEESQHREQTSQQKATFPQHLEKLSDKYCSW